MADPRATWPRSRSSSATTPRAGSASASCAASGCSGGAFATTVAHDAHNIVVVGVDDADMPLCVRRLGEIGGGIACARRRPVRGELPLPVAGLMSRRAGRARSRRRSSACRSCCAEQGVGVAAPFMTLSFLALSVIPALKITDRGLVDVERFSLVPLAVS